MAECKIDRDGIRQSIQDDIAKSLDASKLFNRVSPTEDMSSILEDAKKYAPDVLGMYKDQFLANPEEFMRSIAEQSTASESEAQGALSSAGFDLYDISQKYYNQNLFSPKDLNSPYKEIIQSLNNQYSSEVIRRLDPEKNVYQVSPSESLVDAYEREYEQTNAVYDDERQRISDEDYALILEELELKPLSTPQEFIDNNMQEYSAQISQFRKANPDFTMQFNDEDTKYDENKNIIMIDLTELNAIAVQHDVPLKQVVSTMIIHEMAHAASSKAIKLEDNRSALGQLYLAAINHHKDTIPFEDVMRQGYESPNGQPYALQNMHEFIAEAFSNPYFQEYLQSIPYEGEKSLLQKIWDAILEFFNFTQENKPSLYDEVVRFVNSEKLQRDNRDAESHPSTEWDPQLVFRGTPKTYSQAAFELFTSPAVTDEVYKVIGKLPAAVIKIKQQLDYETDKEKIKKLQSLLNAYNDVKENDGVINVSINMLVQAGIIARDMEQQLLEIPKLDDNSKKLTLAYSLLRNIEALEFIEPLAQDITRIIKRTGETAAIQPFMNMMEDITTAVNSVKRTYVEVAQPLILDRLTTFVGETEAEKTINQEISKLRERAKNTQDNVLQEIIRRQIILEQEKLKLVPNKTNLDLIFAGQYRDSSMGQLLFEAGMMNDHPIPNIVMKIIRQNNIAVSQYMLNVQNEHQKELDTLRDALGISAAQGIRDVDKFFKPIQPLVSRADTVVVDENGSIVLENGKPKFNYTTQKMLLSSYSPDYIKDASEKKALIDFYYKKLSDADRSNNAEDLALYRDKLNQAYKDRRDFMRENSENQYTEEILQMYDLLEKEIKKDDGTITTFGKERGYIFEAIEDAEQRREEEYNIDTLTKLQEEIEGLYIKQKQLKSKYDENGKEKTGLEKQLADIANEYAELKTKYGSYELTERGKAMFEKEKLALQNRLEGDFITEEEYRRRLAEITVTELSDEYYSAIVYYSTRIDEVSKELAAIPEFRTIFKGVNSEAIKEGYDKIKDLVRGFRDNEMTIDGQLFSKVRPELVKEIQKIQQQVEDLKGISEKLRGLSIEDTIRARELRGKKRLATITEEELDELTTLQDKAKASDKLYLQYKELIDQLSKLTKEFSKLNDSSPSQYYIDELDHQKGVLLAEEVKKIEEQMKTLTTLEQGKYQKRNGEWEEVKRIEGTMKVVKAIDMQGYATVEEALANKIAAEHVDIQIRETEWWKDNHYEKYVWGKKGYEKVDSPIYIWVKTEPQDKEFLLEEQPSIRFKTYSINNEYHNPNFSLISDNIPAAKAGKYTNDEYFRMMNSSDSKDKAYFRYLEFARASFKRAQEFIPAERRLGDILPSFVKTADELSVERTNALAQKSMQVLQGQFALGFASDATLDEQSVTGGSTTDFFAKNRVLPVRFSGRMDYNKQSSDIAAMLLSYELAAAEYNQQLEDQPLLEAIRIAVEELPVQESKNLASKFSIANMFASIKSAVSSQTKMKQVTSEKKTDKSTLSKTVDHILSTHVYGETKTSANITVGGMDFDLNKASRGLKKVSSLSIFALNAFVAVKNTVSATIQANINSNIGKGFFTKSQYNKAHIEAMSHVKDFLLDYRKFGNKTQIGQEMDFFQVLQGASYNEFGQKTAWTALKNSESFLTALKNSSEFELQIAQYLAMSKANPVQLADGTWVEMRKAFEMDKDGNLVPKAGVQLTQKQIESFIFKLAYVNRAINGAYRAEEKNMIQKNILGDLAFYLNGYVVPGIVNRFGKTRYSAEADMVTRGYIMQLFSFMGDLVRYRTDINKKWSVMSADEKHRVLRGTKELAAIIGMAILVMALGGGDDKKELKQNQAIANWALSISLAVKAETETFVPIPGMGLNDMARKMNSPFAAVRQVSNVIKALQNFTLYLGDKVGIDAPDAYYKSSSIKDGFHDKGDPKFIANLLKLVGWSGIAFDPVEKALQQKNIQTLR